nr:MAG TPA: hypothetical protein [Caudoviricetes sp.]
MSSKKKIADSSTMMTDRCISYLSIVDLLSYLLRA